MMVDDDQVDDQVDDDQDDDDQVDDQVDYDNLYFITPTRLHILSFQSRKL